MAIAEMSRMKMVGVKSEEEKVVAALHRICSVQIISNTVSDKPFFGAEEVSSKRERLNFACEFLFENANKVAKDYGEKPLKEEVYPVSYDDFINATSLEEKVFETVVAVENLNRRIIEIKSESAALSSERSGYLPYINFKSKFSSVADTQSARVFLGVTSKASGEALAASEINALVKIECLDDNSNCVLSAICLKENESEVSSALAAASFAKCNLKGDFTAKDKIAELDILIKNKQDELKEAEKKTLELSKNLKDMKILLDRYDFELEKVKNSNSFEKTDSTYLLEGYVPTEAVDRVKEAVESQTNCVFLEFEEIARDEFAPTLMKNGKVTEQFEFITNLFSPPSYGAFDHNLVMMIFFSVFMGFIMADMGYGLLMAVGGALFAKTMKRDTGTRRLVYVIAIGGIFTFIFGVLFDSFFGYALLQKIGLLQKPIMPDAINHKTNLAGISVPTLLLLSLGMGVVQIIASLLLKAAQEFSRKNFWGGVFDGVIWALFLVGLILLVLELASVTKGLMTVAIVLTVGSIAVGALTAGRAEKGFGKFTKGFSAVYGIINYLSDILSYARLYGLLLSGMQIASIVTTMALGMMTSVGGIIAGIIVLLIGHIFNLAMGVLGAYIHDSRLQYIEFFGRFYEGDGELFTPFGTKFNNVYFEETAV